ncbi:MAG: hypothetical protein L0322_01315 [Chloroflexi bacterium]|nr:hypothetical protein [Chloroflexota bacterium]MCI0648373.1 hypothetical protein [Chloroflexota bacterium]
MKPRHLLEVGLVLLFVVMASAATLSLLGPQIGNVFSQVGTGPGNGEGCPAYGPPLPNSTGGRALPGGTTAWQRWSRT